MMNNTTTSTLIRKSLWRKCSEAAVEQGKTFSTQGTVYVIDDVQMTPGEAADFLGVN